MTSSNLCLPARIVPEFYRLSQLIQWPRHLLLRILVSRCSTLVLIYFHSPIRSFSYVWIIGVAIHFTVIFVLFRLRLSSLLSLLDSTSLDGRRLLEVTAEPSFVVNSPVFARVIIFATNCLHHTIQRVMDLLRQE